MVQEYLIKEYQTDNGIVKIILELDIEQNETNNTSKIKAYTKASLCSGKANIDGIVTKITPAFTIYDGEKGAFISHSFNSFTEPLRDIYFAEIGIVWNCRYGVYGESENFTVLHNLDGTKKLIFKIGYNVQLGVFPTVDHYRVLASTADDFVVELPTINRGTEILTASNFTDEENPSISYNIHGGTSDLTSLQACISFDGVTAAVPYRDIPTNNVSYTFELTNEERETLRSKTQGSNVNAVYYLVKTIRSNGTEPVEFVSKVERTLTIVNDAPILTPSVTDVNAATIALTGDENTLVKYFSNAKTVFNCFCQKGATLSVWHVKNGTKYASNSIYTFNNVENNEFEFYAKDSRGNITTRTLTPAMVDYIKITCNLGNNLVEPSGNYTFNVSGKYFNGSFGSVYNTLTVQRRIRHEYGEWEDWVTIPHELSGNNYNATETIAGLSYKTNYFVEVRAIDKLMAVTTPEKSIQSVPVFDWSNKDFNFNCDVRIKGDLRLKGDGNYGNRLYFGDSSYAYIGEESDDNLTFHASGLTLSAVNLNLNGANAVNVNGEPLPLLLAGSWVPWLTSNGAVQSYQEQSGWYMRVGNTVTIGFTIKATCYSGHTGTSISIGNAPYYPTQSAAGGGIAYNVYVAGGFCFEGWLIGTDGAITPRLCPCNNTSAGNLNIASTAGYTSGGGSFTLMGTITYQTND